MNRRLTVSGHKHLILVIGLLLNFYGVRAEDVLTVDFPITASVTKSSRLQAPPQQVTLPNGTGYTEFALLPASEDQDLLVTVVFEENGEKGPSLFWMGEEETGQITISKDLSEGITGTNQRTIQVPREASIRPGKLIVSGDQAKISRVRLDWVSLRKVYAATDQRPVAFIVNDRFLQTTDLSGEKSLSPPDIWVGKILEASLQEQPEALSENIEFVAPLEEDVAQAVLTLKVLGLPLDKTVEIWVNGIRAGQVQPAIPALSDAGYLKDTSGKTTYAGWRHGSLYIPSDLLKKGDNSIVVVAPGGQPFLRDAALQLRPAREASAQPEEIIISEASLLQASRRVLPDFCDAFPQWSHSSQRNGPLPAGHSQCLSENPIGRFGGACW